MDDELAHYREVRGLKTLFLKQIVAVNPKRQTERKLRMRVQGMEEDISEWYGETYHDVMDMCRIVKPDMVEEVLIDHLFRGLSPALYNRLYVLGNKSCEECLEETRLHADAVKTAYEKVPDSRTEGRASPCRRSFEEEGERRGKSEWNKKQKTKNLIRCFNCNEEGHIARSCQKENKAMVAKPKNSEGEEPKAACAVIVGDQTTEITNCDRQPTEEIWISGRPVNALVDTGEKISVILPSLASKL
ncbi:hypothetical protein OUZ56_005978 [Daphnia magna]|uniref:CCHC-type domain-containing protein n=1 Tax=Daphnia magna TaxID=35525 RepID=A0ABQ9YUA0_9CRUS|nr:hypothetical protein OUZ56_005978 [Daphnia magna]